MQLKLTGPMQKAMTWEILNRIERALREFPELDGRKITVGLNLKPGLHGSAESQNMVIRLNPRRRVGVTYFTIGHELTHLLQKPGLGIVPNGEIQCDIFTLARSDLFLDDKPTYLRYLYCTDKTWKLHARAVREMCVQAVEVRKTNRTYIRWLQLQLQRYFCAASELEIPLLAKAVAAP